MIIYKRNLISLILFCLLISIPTYYANAQTQDKNSTQVVDSLLTSNSPGQQLSPPVQEEKASLHGALMQKFIEGGPIFMSLVLGCLIFGLAFAIERILSLSLASTNSQKLLQNVEKSLSVKDIEHAKEICRSNRSPLASVMYQGLDRIDEGIDVVEKSVVAYGSVQMGLLEKGLVWISLFISLAPMLGFMGTVLGMIDAFDSIEKAGAIVASEVAGGIKIALITTVSGLIVAVILQVFYNFIVSRIDSIVNDMEDGSITFIDILLKYKLVNK